MTTSSETIVFSRDDLDLIVVLAGCSLDEKPGSNWIQESGGLPDYICRIAKAIRKTGKSTSQSIAIAVSRVKKWAAGGDDVDAATRAKAAKALAEWEKLKAKNKTRKKDVKASGGQGEILLLTEQVSVFNVDLVRRAWEMQADAWRTKWRQQNPLSPMDDGPPYSYITEMWTDHLIVRSDEKLYWVDYGVDTEGDITFGDQKPVKTQYVVIDSGDMVGERISNTELRTLMASVGPCHATATDQVLLSIGQRPSAMDQVLQTIGKRQNATEQVLLSIPQRTSALETVLSARRSTT